MFRRENHNGVIYVNIHSTEIAVGVTKINEVKMGKYTNLGEKKAKGRMIKDKWYAKEENKN